jgi:hypothetical protein
VMSWARSRVIRGWVDGKGSMSTDEERTVLLTGATGFVGQCVHQPLVQAGWSVPLGPRWRDATLPSI